MKIKLSELRSVIQKLVEAPGDEHPLTSDDQGRSSNGSFSLPDDPTIDSAIEELVAVCIERLEDNGVSGAEVSQSISYAIRDALAQFDVLN